MARGLIYSSARDTRALGDTHYSRCPFLLYTVDPTAILSPQFRAAMITSEPATWAAYVIRSSSCLHGMLTRRRSSPRRTAQLDAGAYEVILQPLVWCVRFTQTQARYALHPLVDAGIFSLLVHTELASARAHDAVSPAQLALFYQLYRLVIFTITKTNFGLWLDQWQSAALALAEAQCQIIAHCTTTRLPLELREMVLQHMHYSREGHTGVCGLGPMTGICDGVRDEAGVGILDADFTPCCDRTPWASPDTTILGSRLYDEYTRLTDRLNYLAKDYNHDGRQCCRHGITKLSPFAAYYMRTGQLPAKQPYQPYSNDDLHAALVVQNMCRRYGPDFVWCW